MEDEGVVISESSPKPTLMFGDMVGEVVIVPYTWIDRPLDEVYQRLLNDTADSQP